MGQEISKAYTPPPISLRDCLVDGQIDFAHYRIYSRRQYDDEYEDIHQTRLNKRKKSSYPPKSNRKKTKRSVKKHDIEVRDKDGTICSATFRDSTWHTLYVDSPPTSNRRKKAFRKRFRLPYDVYLNMVHDIKSHDLFSRWTHNDCIGVEPSDIRLLLLGTLRYLGRALTFDDLEEYTFISAEVHRQFFIAFLEYGSTILYNKYIIQPASELDVSEFEKVFAMAGFNGCIGSADATHVGLLQCPTWAIINHKGHKLAIPSRNYNATVTHSRQILGTTSCGHPGTWNDKTLVLYDGLIRGVHEGELYSDNEFKLIELNDDNEEVEVTYKGAWFIVDNGYLNWSCTVPPIKHPITYEEIRFSEWLESMRKDVECTFGILKKRFSVLKTGFRLQSIAQCDKVWRTCCALHNLLLFNDGLDKNWETGKKMKTSSCDVNDVIPFAIQRLISNDKCSNNHTKYEKDYFKKYSLGGKRVVSKIPLDIFQERLIHHFDIRFKNNDIKWPQRKKNSNKDKK